MRWSFTGAVRGGAALGVDFGSVRTKAVALVPSAGGIAKGGTVCFDNPPDCVASAVIQSPKRLGRALAAELRLAGIATRAATFTVPTRSATIRWVRVPLVAGEELREAATFKMRRELPAEPDAFYIAASAPVPDGDDATGLSSAVAVPKAVVDSRAEALLAAGLEPVRGELEAEALLRAVRATAGTAGSVAAIDLGPANAQIHIVDGGRLRFIHGIRLPSGGGAVEVAGKLTRELGRLVRYLRLDHAGAGLAPEFDRVLLSGGASETEGLMERLRIATGLPVEVTHSGCPACGGTFAVAAGAALFGIELVAVCDQVTTHETEQRQRAA